MRKILFSLLTIGLVVTSAAAGTRAYFSDTETSTGNTFTAGILDLLFDSEESAPFEVGNIAPGDSGEQTFTLLNAEGSMDGSLSVSIENLLQWENSLTEPELNPGFGTSDYEAGPNAGELKFFLVMAMFVDVNQNATFDSGDIQLTYNGQQAAYPGFWGGSFNYHPVTSMVSPWNDIMTLADGQSVDLVVMWKMLEDNIPNYSPNIAMTDSMTFDFSFLLNQL